VSAEGIITLGIGSDPGGLLAFFTLGLQTGEAAVVTPAARTYAVEADDRTYAVEVE
jgi:hypothetical protein